MEELRDKLLDWAKQFETPDFIKDDPIFFPHKYNDKKDIEISAFLTSWIAFGNRKLIMQQAEILDNLMGNYNPQIQISAESETKRSIFREKDKTKRSKKESAQHSKSRNKSFVMTSVSAL